jgi:aminoglycoside phosphotransferase (APT) family kinase protein
VSLTAAAAAARPGVVLREAAGPADELVRHGGGEVLRLPRTPEAAERLVLLVRALPRLRPLVPVAVPQPRLVGVLADGETPFTAEARLPGVPGRPLEGPAVGQLAGLLAALADVPVREARSWGVPGDGVLVHGALTPAALLVDPRRGVLTGVVGWRLRLGDPAEDLAGLDPALRAALG